MIKKKWYIALGVILLIIPMLIYGGGYIAQFMIGYNEWEQNGGGIGSRTSPPFPSATITECFKAAFTAPEGLIGILVCFGLLVLLIIMVMKLGFGERGEYDRERNLTYSPKGTYGTAGFMTEAEMSKVLDVKNIGGTNGIVLGKIDGKAVSLPADTRMNRNIAVYGASGSMKSRAFARNAILQAVKRSESIIVTDPKSELYEDMAVYLENEGYTVRIFNLINIENSDSWNCLSEIEGSELMAQVFADVIIKNTGSERGDHFWDNSELNLLKALVLYVEREAKPENKNIGEVYNMLTNLDENAMNKLFSMLPISHPAKAPYSIFKQAADTVRGGIIIGLGSRLQVFQNHFIKKITAYDEIDMELPGKEKCAYFCITSDQDSTFDFLSSLFFSFLFIKLVRYADKYGENGKLEVFVNFILDEFPNIGMIPDFTKKISTIRSRGISAAVIFQNLAQMKNRYPFEQWQEIIGNCDTQLFLGCTDEMTAKFISDRTGEVTIGVSSKMKNLGTWRISDYTPEYRESSSIGKRKLLTPDEVLRLPIEKALIILRGQQVLKVDKFDYSLHPDSKKLVKRKAALHSPLWTQEILPQDSSIPVEKDTPKLSKPTVKKTDKKSILGG